MKEKEITCIICPSSCRIAVKGTETDIESIKGHSCERGIEYATTEFLAPKRNLTATVKAIGYKAPIVSVRTSKPIPKDMQMECMEIIKNIEVEAPFEIGRVVYQNILGTESDIILTNN